MKLISIAAILALAAASAAGADSRVASLCGAGHANEVVSGEDIRANPDGYYVASLREQVSLGDPRIVPTTADDYYLCSVSQATPEMPTTQVLLLRDQRRVKVLFVPICPDRARPAS